MSMLDYDPDISDDEGTYGWCEQCECNVGSIKVDFGIGGYEYWGSKEVHHEWREVCPRCEGDLTDARTEEEEA
jgi:Zn finger protein HypA/HybF involved in hydrogenase expression